MGLAGVTVMLSGMADGQTTTDDSGQFSFTGLRAGTYSVEISGFDTNEVSFSSTSGAATVGVGESKVVSFDGTYLRTAGIQGQVSVDGEGLGGVTVTLVGEGEERTDVTNAGGLYAFSALKSGTYQVAITNPDPDDYEFTTTSKSATVATGETANVPFEGTLLRTAGIAGRVSLDDGMGLDGVTVTLAGAAEATARRRTAGSTLRRAGGGHVRAQHREPGRQRVQLRRRRDAEDGHAGRRPVCDRQLQRDAHPHRLGVGDAVHRRGDAGQDVHRRRALDHRGDRAAGGGRRRWTKRSCSGCWPRRR